MGSAGFILGGLLSGLGQGASQEIADRRAMALQQLRGQQAAESDARRAKADEAAADKKYERDKGLLGIQSALKVAENNAASGNRITETKVKGGIDMQLQGQKIEGEKGLARLKGEIDRSLAAQKGSIDQAEIRLRDELGKGDVQSAQQTADGRWFIIKNDGSTITTQKIGAPPGQRNGDADDPITARAGGKSAATPSPTPAQATKPIAQPKKASDALPVLSREEYNRAYSKAAAKVTRGENGWSDLKTEDQLRARLAEVYQAAGYRIPAKR